jgi:hypothetical protein
MRTAFGICAAICLATVGALTAQSSQGSGQQPIRVGVELIRVDALVKDRQGRFVPNLTKDDFQLFEDGARQEIITLTMTVGGRVFSTSPASAPRDDRGVVLPPHRPPADRSGRVVVIFVDDAHLDARGTPRLRHLLQTISSELIHDGDLYVRKAQDSLRVLADLTGGVPIINSNDFTRGLKRIDEETSDYYVLGYYSSNPDPARRRRLIEVKSSRPDVKVTHRREYVSAPR